MRGGIEAMIISLEKILLYVQLDKLILDPITINSVEYKISKIGPSISEFNREKFLSKGVSLADLFFLEPPRTFKDLISRRDFYGLTIDLMIEPLQSFLNHEL
jgi:hypothetical protein